MINTKMLFSLSLNNNTMSDFEPHSQGWAGNLTMGHAKVEKVGKEKYTFYYQYQIQIHEWVLIHA